MRMEIDGRSRKLDFARHGVTACSIQNEKQDYTRN